MSPVESWALDEVRTRLVAAAQTGDSVSFESLREEVGIGHEDLSAVLDHLRTEGEAREEAPGEWAADDGVTARESDAEASVRVAMRRRDGQLGEGEEGPAALAPRARAAYLAETPAAGEVVLTMAVAQALDPETIGKLVVAGINEAQEADRAFVLRVQP